MDTITYNNETYAAGEMLSGRLVLGESLAAAGLSVDTLEAEMRFTSPPSPVQGAEVVHHGGGRRRTFYLTAMERTGRETYRLTAVSEIGLLDGGEHMGGIYNGITGSLAPDVIADIVGGAFPFEVDDTFADTALYGWLPIASRRDNLRQVLFAIGASVRRSDDGLVRFAPLEDAVAHTIEKGRIYTGGRAESPVPASAAVITEHSYVPDGEERRLYTGATAEGQLVRFSAPHHSLRCEGALILDEGANFARLSASAEAKLYGCGYDHGTKIITLGDTSGAAVTSSGCTLVSMANSLSVARRVLAYHSSPMDIRQSFASHGERPGDRVRFSDPFGEEHEGYIKKMELEFGALTRAEATFDTGYIPTGVGNDYDAVLTVTESGTYTLPDTDRVRIVLIGGGSGGQGGAAGSEGNVPDGSGTASSASTEYVLKAESSGVWAAPEDDDRYYYWYESAEGRMGSDGAKYVFLYGGPKLMTIADAYAAGYMFRKYYASGALDEARCCAMNGRGASGGVPMYLYSVLAVTATSVAAKARRRYYTSRTPGGAGGVPGASGRAGRVFQTDLDVTPGGTLRVTIGAGGTGGASAASGETGENGAEGGDTTLTIGGVTLTSADGVVLSSGYVDVMGGAVYALGGENGLPGGDGGAYNSHDVGETGGASGNYSGGRMGSTATNSTWGAQAYSGGSGGGASADAQGGVGGAGKTAMGASGPGYSGDGGKGADAVKPPTPTSPGSAGHGGNGGGGGGNAGGCTDARSTGSVNIGAAGAGGAGAPGGDGSPGIALIYYGTR